MTFDEYVPLAMRTLSGASGEDFKSKMTTAAIGFSGEVGEFNEHIKKWLFHGHPSLDVPKLEKELGDILWYWACAVSALELNPNEVAEKNIRKLKDRYPVLFYPDGSINKNEENEAQVHP